MGGRDEEQGGTCRGGVERRSPVSLSGWDGQGMGGAGRQILPRLLALQKDSRLCGISRDGLGRQNLTGPAR